MNEATQVDQDLREIHHHLTRAILFLDRNRMSDEAQALLTVKVTLPLPKKQSEKRKRADAR